MNPVTRLRRWIDDLRESYREWQAKRRRHREAGVTPGERVRDGFTGNFLRVVEIRNEKAEERILNGSPLSEYGDNRKLDCAGDWVVECRYPVSDETYDFPASRLRKSRIKRGRIVRDKFDGETLKIRNVRNIVASELEDEGTPLPEMGLNQKLDCSRDWVADCTYYGSSERYAFPLSRLVPQKYPTRPESWKERVINTRECYSCEDGIKKQESNAACQECRERIKRRDGYECQQKGCSATSNLQVHHLYYQPNLDGLIPDEYLITLCRNCHKERHGID
jgi:hypothetical protein